MCNMILLFVALAYSWGIAPNCSQGSGIGSCSQRLRRQASYQANPNLKLWIGTNLTVVVHTNSVLIQCLNWQTRVRTVVLSCCKTLNTARKYKGFLNHGFSPLHVEVQSMPSVQSNSWRKPQFGEHGYCKLGLISQQLLLMAPFRASLGLSS